MNRYILKDIDRKSSAKKGSVKIMECSDKDGRLSLCFVNSKTLKIESWLDN